MGETGTGYLLLAIVSTHSTSTRVVFALLGVNLNTNAPQFARIWHK